MPNFNEFKVNENLLDEVRRVKNNEANQFVIPIKIPNNVTTIEPDNRIDILEWFEHIKKTQRERDLFGNIITY